MVKKTKPKKKADESIPKNADFLMSLVEQDLKKRTSPKIAAKKNVSVKEKKHTAVQEQPMNTVASSSSSPLNTSTAAQQQAVQQSKENSPAELTQDEETDLFSW